MRQTTNSSFNEGLLMDMNPLVTPQTCLTDCLNGTLITYNGNEFTLQNDMGNVKIAKSEISPGYIPMGIKEYGGIIYLALYNPELNRCEIGSIPSPNYDVSPSDNDLSEFPIDSSSMNFITSNQDNSYTFNQKLIKLFEFEQLTLNPGDQYVLCYSISENTENVFDEESIYKVTIYAIDKDNKQHKLENPNLINSNFPTNKDYKYFDNTISSVLGLQISINQINWFETTVYQVDKTKIKFRFFGKNKLGTTNPKDDLYIRGCKIEFNNRTFYLDGGTNTENFEESYEFNLSDIGLTEGDMVDFSIIPYDQYTYLHNLKRKLKLTIGKEFSPSQSGDIFKYKYSSENKSLRLDFNLPAYMDDPYMYVEFYDIWSDYSVIIPVEDINPLGINTLFLNTVNEPVINEYSETQGGVDKTLLSNYDINLESGSGKIYKPFLSNIIRRNGLLRENNMYLVRMAVIDKSKIKENQEIAVSDYLSKYKLLIINENYNSLYDQLNDSGINVNNNSNFNNLNLNNKLTVNLDTNLTLLEKGNITSIKDGNFTIKTDKNGKTYYYKYTETEESIPVFEEQTETFNKSDKYSVVSKIKNITNSFGSVSLNSYTITDTDYSPVVKDSDSTVKSQSTLIRDGNNLSFSLSTNRLIKAYTFKEYKSFQVINENKTKRIIDYFYTPSNKFSAGLYMKGRKTSKYPRDVFKYNLDGSLGSQVNDMDTGWDGVAGVALSQSFERIDNNIIYSGASLNTIGKYDGASFALKLIDTNQIINKDWFMTFRGVDGNGIGIVYNSKQAVIDILSDLQSSIVENTLKYLYYYNNVEFDKLSKTELEGTLDLKINANLNIFQNVKFEDSFHSSETNEDFLSKLNILLASKSIPTINKIDYFNLGTLNQDVNTILDIPFMSIEAGASEELRQALINGKNDLFLNHPEISNPTDIKDQTVYSKSGLYENIAKRFSVIYENEKPKFYYNPQNLKSAKWMVGGSGDKNDGKAFDIDINPFDIH